MLGIVDTLMVAQLGTEALAGVGAAIQIMFFVISTLSATSVGSSVLVAQAVGAHAYDKACQFAKQSLVWSVILSVPLALVGLFLAAEHLIALFGMEPAVNEIGTAYLRVTMGTVVVLTLLILSGGILRGAGDSRTPMIVTAIANGINIVLTYGLIFGRLGMPELGVVGSAWGTFLSRLIGFILLFVVLWRGVNGVSIRGKDQWRPEFGLARQILGIGLPAATEQVLTSTAFLLLTVVVAQIGTVALAAHRIAFNALSLAFLPGFGFGIAATALVGQSIGAQALDEGKKIASIATKWAVLWMGLLGLVFFFFGENIMRLFSDDPTVIAMGAAGLRPVALVQPFFAILIVQSGALRGTGDTRYPLRVNTSGIWAAVILGAIIVQTFGGELAAIWSAFLLTAPLTAYLMWRRFQQTISQKELVAAI